MTNNPSKRNIDNLDETTKQEVINLVVARLRTMPSDASLSIGGKGNFSIDELVNDVEQGNDIGLSVIQTQLDYLRSLKDLPLDDPIAI